MAGNEPKVKVGEKCNFLTSLFGCKSNPAPAEISTSPSLGTGMAEEARKSLLNVGNRIDAAVDAAVQPTPPPSGSTPSM